MHINSPGDGILEGNLRTANVGARATIPWDLPDQVSLIGRLQPSSRAQKFHHILRILTIAMPYDVHTRHQTLMCCLGSLQTSGMARDSSRLGCLVSLRCRGTKAIVNEVRSTTKAAPLTMTFFRSSCLAYA